jgi:lysozyme
MNKVSPMAIDMAINMLIKPLEGCKLIPYLCPARKPTIGIGSCYYENGNKVTMIDKAITIEQAEYLCTQFINVQIVPCLETWVINPLQDNENAALISEVYNIGVNAFAGSAMLKVINISPNHPDVGKNMMLFNKATIDGKLVVVKGLNNRRQLERDVFVGLKALNELTAVGCDYHDNTILEVA